MRGKEMAGETDLSKCRKLKRPSGWDTSTTDND